jgi:hypothetical protein
VIQQGPGRQGAQNLKRGRDADASASDDEELSDADEGEHTSCSKAQRADKADAVTPWIAFDCAVALLDRDYRARYAAVAPPIATPLAINVGLTIEHGVGYAGDGTLAIAQGNATFYTDAGCTAPLVDGNGLPLTPAHAITIPNAQLAAPGGLALWALGRARGPFELTLTLAAQGNWLIQRVARQNATVVEVELHALSLAPNRVPLVEGQQIVYGRHAGIAPANAAAFRVPVTIAACNPGGAWQPVLQCSVVNAITVRPNEWVQPQNDADVLPQALPDQQQTLYVQGEQAGNPCWLSLGLQLPAGGPILSGGDLLRVRPAAQERVSVGFEWECNALKVERHDIDGVALHRPEGLPSKATVFRSHGMQLDTEVSQAGETYGEFVCGPAYDHAELEQQLGQVLRAYDALRANPRVFVRVPADITSREFGHYADVWMLANHRVVLLRPLAWGGTAQSTFAVRMWLLSTYLANLAGPPAIGAKAAAETFAAQCANDLANHPDREVTDLVIGLITACEYYIRVFENAGAINDDDGPKTATPVMFRTDFHAMYGLLENIDQRNAFAEWCNTHPHGANRLMPAGYSTGGGNREAQGPTIAQWLASIINPPADGQVQGYATPAVDLNKDLLSPPPGFGRHWGNHPIKYGMGKLKTDPTTGAVIAECRTYMGNAGWATFVEKAFEFAAECNLAGAPTWVRDHERWDPPGGHPALNVVNGYLQP